MAEPVPAPRPPRLPRELAPLVDPELDDQGEWSEREVCAELLDRVATDVSITASRLVRSALTGSTLPRLELRDTVLEGCDLSGVVIDQALITRVELHECRMSGFVATRATLRDVRFVGCRLDEANFRMTKGERVAFEECDLRGADFYEAELVAASLRGCDLTGADVSGANLRGARLHGSRLDDLKGARSLAGAVIDPDQVVMLSRSLLHALDIEVDDEDDPRLDGE